MLPVELLVLSVLFGCGTMCCARRQDMHSVYGRQRAIVRQPVWRLQTSAFEGRDETSRPVLPQQTAKGRHHIRKIPITSLEKEERTNIARAVETLNEMPAFMERYGLPRHADANSRALIETSKHEGVECEHSGHSLPYTREEILAFDCDNINDHNYDDTIESLYEMPTLYDEGGYKRDNDALDYEEETPTYYDDLENEEELYDELEHLNESPVLSNDDGYESNIDDPSEILSELPTYHNLVRKLNKHDVYNFPNAPLILHKKQKYRPSYHVDKSSTIQNKIPTRFYENSIQKPKKDYSWPTPEKTSMFSKRGQLKHNVGKSSKIQNKIPTRFYNNILQQPKKVYILPAPEKTSTFYKRRPLKHNVDKSSTIEDKVEFYNNLRNRKNKYDGLGALRKTPASYNRHQHQSNVHRSPAIKNELIQNYFNKQATLGTRQEKPEFYDDQKYTQSIGDDWASTGEIPEFYDDLGFEQITGDNSENYDEKPTFNDKTAHKNNLYYYLSQIPQEDQTIYDDLINERATDKTGTLRTMPVPIPYSNQRYILNTDNDFENVDKKSIPYDDLEYEHKFGGSEIADEIPELYNYQENGKNLGNELEFIDQTPTFYDDTIYKQNIKEASETLDEKPSLLNGLGYKYFDSEPPIYGKRSRYTDKLPFVFDTVDDESEEETGLQQTGGGMDAPAAYQTTWKNTRSLKSEPIGTKRISLCFLVFVSALPIFGIICYFLLGLTDAIYEIFYVGAVLFIVACMYEFFNTEIHGFALAGVVLAIVSSCCVFAVYAYRRRKPHKTPTYIRKLSKPGTQGSDYVLQVG